MRRLGGKKTVCGSEGRQAVVHQLTPAPQLLSPAAWSATRWPPRPDSTLQRPLLFFICTHTRATSHPTLTSWLCTGCTGRASRPGSAASQTPAAGWPGWWWLQRPSAWRQPAQATHLLFHDYVHSLGPQVQQPQREWHLAPQSSTLGNDELPHLLRPAGVPALIQLLQQGSQRAAVEEIQALRQQRQPADVSPRSCVRVWVVGEAAPRPP